MEARALSVFVGGATSTTEQQLGDMLGVLLFFFERFAHQAIDVAPKFGERRLKFNTRVLTHGDRKDAAGRDL